MDAEATATKDDAPKSVFQQNLLKLIGDKRLTAWARDHGLSQPNIWRLLKTQDPKLSSIEELAAALKMEAWELMAANMQRSRPLTPLAREVADLIDSVPEHDVRRSKLYAKAEALFGEAPRDEVDPQRAGGTAAGANPEHAAHP